MPKGSKYYTTSKAAATTGTPLADITDANITDPNKRQKLDGDADFALDPKLQAAADGSLEHVQRGRATPVVNPTVHGADAADRGTPCRHAKGDSRIRTQSIDISN